MSKPTKKQTRPSTTPVPIRFTEKMMAEVEEVAEDLDLSRQDVIRLSVAAGLKSLRRIGWDGIADAVAEHFPSPPEPPKKKGK